MVTMTLAVPEDLKKKMDSFPEMNWSEVARQAFQQKVKDMQLLERFKSKSTFNEKDALTMGKEISRAVSNKLRQLAN